jgi:hypothetical protein
MITRRTVLVQITATALLAGCAPPVLTPLREEAVSAKSLGYKIDARLVDAAAFPSYSAGQLCRNCRLVTRTDGELLPCNAYPGYSVAAGGWCASYEVR